MCAGHWGILFDRLTVLVCTTFNSFIS